MTLTLDLPKEVEDDLAAEAALQGLPLGNETVT